MLSIVIPVLGEGRRFKEAGYEVYKADLPVGDKTMLQAVLDNIRPKEPSRIHLLTRDKYPQKTQGAACSVLLVRDQIDPDEELLIANCDQLVDVDMGSFLWKMRQYDAGIMTFESYEQRWSYARVENGLVTQVAEKKVISNEATVGIYYFKRADDFFRNADWMIAKNIRVNNEFYVCPVFNELLQEGAQVGIYHIEKDAMHGLGTPEDYQTYVKSLSI